MRLISARLQNYRVHRELALELDPGRTLVGGPNESGKSTLAEAIHRALFLKSKVTGEALSQMESRHGGNPAVELCFEAGGKRYELKKVFAGARGTSTLTVEGGETLSGESAEERLAGLLRVEAPVGGKGAAERLAHQWAHLWVWQGLAGQNPSAHANTQRDALLARLKHGGGAAVMQSDLDAKAAAHFADLSERLFKSGGPRAHTEWADALRVCEAAVLRETEARASFERLRLAAADFELATEQARACGERLEALSRDRAEVEAKLIEVSALQVAEASQTAEARAAHDRCKSLEVADQRIRELRAAIAAGEKALLPKTAELAQLETAAAARKALADQAMSELDGAGAKVRALRWRHDLSRAHQQVFELNGQKERLSTRLDKVRQFRGDLADVERSFAALPAVDETSLGKLRKLETRCSNAEATLRAMAAGIEVLSAADPVVAGDTVLPVGETRILTEETEIRLGTGTRLRIRPGGGTSLAEARAALQDVQRDLRAALDQLGVASVPEASSISAKRQQLGRRMAEANAVLREMGAEQLENDLAACAAALARAEAAVTKLSAQAVDAQPPGDRSAAENLERKTAFELRQLEDQEVSLRVRRDAALRALTEAGAALHARKAELEAERTQLDGLKARLSVLIQTEGDDEARAAGSRAARTTWETAERVLQATGESLRNLQPQLLETRRKNCALGLNHNQNQLLEWKQKLAVARNVLTSDGVVDPKGALAQAEAGARTAKERLQSVERRAKALQLLHQLFLEEQRALAEQFTRPLAERISKYLQCLFGPGARAKVTLEENQFAGLEIVRPGRGAGSFDFDTLSGGAKEQMAAAVRLAMAEILAQDHGGSLPLLFDDAFAYSDPQRVRTLQDMLGLAAEQGLQIIILTCNPSDYTNLGARLITIRSSG
jgi:recombinational DNA repair ATPase RecF